MTPFPVLLVTHPGLGSGLITAARAVIGDVSGIDVMDDPFAGSLEDAIGAWVDAHPGPALVLADLNFGSCCNSARRATRGRADVAVLSGVNLSMVLAALASRGHGSLAAFVDHVRDRGRDEVQGYLDGQPR